MVDRESGKGSRSLRPLELLRRWPVLRQLTEGDPLGLGRAVRSPHTAALRPRTENADRVVGSICPYCAVGCAQSVYVKDGEIVHIKGDPDSPISRGRLCPGKAVRVRGRRAHPQPHPRYRLAWRRHPRQRGELPHQEAPHRARGGAGREPGTDMTQLHGPQWTPAATTPSGPAIPTPTP